MQNITDQYARFVTGVTWDSLPQSVVREVKRILLDSVGCAVAGLSTDKAKHAVELALRQGGAHEASILGLGTKVPAASAAFANAEMVNGLDYNASLNGAAAVPVVLPSALATAEASGVSGRDLILGLAIGLEGAARMQHAFPRTMELVREGPDRGKTVVWDAFGHSGTIFGAAAAAGKILGLDKEQTLNAMGIAGYIAPVAPQGKWNRTPNPPMTKYCMVGWVARAAVTAASLAELGYTGDQTVLDGEFGFWKYYLPQKWTPEVLLEGLGLQWYVPKAFYKPYPCCREWHTLLDCFTHIIETNALAPEDIEEVRLYTRKETFDWPILASKDIRSQTGSEMSAPYAIAVAAHRVKLTDWHDFDTIRNPSVVAFMEKVRLEAYSEWARISLETPGSDPAAVEVVSQGKVFREERRFGRGGARVRGGGRISTDTVPADLPAGVVATDADLTKKFKDNVSRVLPQNKVDRIIESIMGLEDVSNVAELVGLIKL